ncbi:MAG: threonine--tRNA ligase [Acetivibrionales bacterium]|jgi:threonyl-tRNA synthetase|nr:threonine--tRNA ligase [Clostridiaceae bacterium]
MIQIKLKDGSAKSYEKGITILEVAKNISEGLARVALAGEVNGELKDLRTQLNEDCQLNLLTFDDQGGKHTYWHTASHIMAQAVRKLFPGVKLAIGPAIDTGFYYDFDLDKNFTPEDMAAIEKEMQKIIKEDIVIERFSLPRDKALELMKDEPYKVELIKELPEDAEISFYKQGDFTDLCAGPHLMSTGKVKAVKLMQLAGAYWRGDEKNKMLQRIYGTAFPKASQLEEYLKMLEEAEKRDHRRLGKELDLFSFDEEVGPGLVLWHPKGARIRMHIEDFWRKQHLRNGYDLVNTPHIGRGQLWETSGHLGFYKEGMYSAMDVDGQDFYAKPMNCPFHIAIYKSKLHSYRDLPYRWAELGTVYRYEKSGALHGLLRVRGFTQDDAHLFCAPEQMPDEIRRVLRFCLSMLNDFGFKDYKIYVSTKPKDKYVGDDSMWAAATKALKEAVIAEGLDCDVDEGGGAFYGPKIDIKIKDALNREWQCSTIQFDFNEPERFDMTYVASDGSKKRPYMIHRALLGSIERFFGILIEHYAGAFPVWLAPVQAKIIPILEKHHDFAQKVADKLKEHDVDVEIDNRNEKIGFKIREAQLEKIPYMLVIGDKEFESESVAVRSRKDGDLGTMTVDSFVEKIVEEIRTRS